jgi:glycosyltransferase involved in cell wall biosynthesis
VAPYAQSVGFSSPVKIFDYMACEKPVIASRIVGTTDSFEESGAILLIEPQNPKILAKKVIYLLKNKKTGSAMGEKGRRFIVNQYDRNLLTKNLILEVQNKFQKKADSINYHQQKVIQI